MGNSHQNLLLRNHWANCSQTLVEWSLDGPLPKLCPVIPTSNQDGRQAKNRKKGGKKLRKIFSETTEPNSTKLYSNDPWVVPFQNCVRQRRPVSKMATVTKNRNFFKRPKLLYFKPECAKFVLYKHNEELFNIYYRIFYEL
jgi:hypothetical protein